jgi:hypothetical protein
MGFKTDAAAMADAKLHYFSRLELPFESKTYPCGAPRHTTPSTPGPSESARYSGNTLGSINEPTANEVVIMIISCHSCRHKLVFPPPMPTIASRRSNAAAWGSAVIGGRHRDQNVAPSMRFFGGWKQRPAA